MLSVQSRKQVELLCLLSVSCGLFWLGGKSIYSSINSIALLYVCSYLSPPSAPCSSIYAIIFGNSDVPLASNLSVCILHIHMYILISEYIKMLKSWKKSDISTSFRQTHTKPAGFLWGGSGYSSILDFIYGAKSRTR